MIKYGKPSKGSTSEEGPELGLYAMLMKAMIGIPNYKLKSVALALLCALGSGYERRHLDIFFGMVFS